jgi:hypothetical protein
LRIDDSIDDSGDDARADFARSARRRLARVFNVECARTRVAMSKRRYLVGIVFVAVVGVVGSRYWAATSSSSRARAPAGITAVERAARELAASRLAQVAPAPVPPQGVGRFSAELLRPTEDKFRRMVAVRGLIGRREAPAPRLVFLAMSPVEMSEFSPDMLRWPRAQVIPR